MYFHNSDAYISKGSERSFDKNIQILKDRLNKADAVVIGAGSGLSTAAGYTYTGERFKRYFSDLEKKYDFHDMYSGGFYPYSSMEEFWGFWCRYIWINRYTPIPSDLYNELFNLVKDKDYFVLTTNVDHCFQRAGFDKHRLFYTQGDYGLFQSSNPHGASKFKTYDNYEIIKNMVLSEGFEISENNDLLIPENKEIKMTVPSELVPHCPDDGELMTTNLRGDDTFVEDKGWHIAAKRYDDFMNRHHDLKVLFIEAGVGGNTPVIIKYNFWRKTYEWPHASYACLNYGEAFAPDEIKSKSICINGDIKDIVQQLENQ